MNNEKLRKLAEEVHDVIVKNDIDFEMFAVNITVTRDYFDLVKNDLNSTVPVPSSQMFTEVDGKWVINLIRPQQ